MLGRLGADRFSFQVRCFGWEFNLALWKPSWGPWEPWRFWVRPGCRAQRRKWGSLQDGDGETFFEIMKLSRSRKKYTTTYTIIQYTCLRVWQWNPASSRGFEGRCSCSRWTPWRWLWSPFPPSRWPGRQFCNCKISFCWTLLADFPNVAIAVNFHSLLEVALLAFKRPLLCTAAWQ